jgi:hypothetical protein
MARSNRRDSAIFITIALLALPFSASGDDAAVVRLTVRPMPAPRPALKYQLLPETRELKSGNAAQNYLKCFMEQRYFFFTKEAAAERARYQAMPLGQLPLDKVRHYGGSALRHADWAARLDAVDWQTVERVQSGQTESLADELGPLQNLAAALNVRFRAEVAERHFDDAIRTAKTMFALARHLGEYPSQLAALVGLSSAHLGLGTLEEMVQQPGCPNLYWALTDLPCPLVELRAGVQGDRTALAADLQTLRDGAPMTESEIEGFVSRLSGALGFAREQAGLPPRSLRAALRERVGNAEHVGAAYNRLAAAGGSPELVALFPPSQAVLLDEKRDYEIERDERMLLRAVPLWQLEPRIGPAEGARDRGGLFADLLPPVVKLRHAQARLEQQIGILRLVEALRLYAAAHDGKLPVKLSDLTMPLPIDPVSGRALDYALDGLVGHIRGRSLPGDAAAPASTVHYEVAIQK